MILIEGNFSILGSAPDGDSIRFIAHNPAHWGQLEQPVTLNRAGGIQLRLDAIDSLETHFQPPNSRIGNHHQPPPYAEQAAARLLEILGFDQVQRNDNGRVTEADPATTPGYILTSFADQYGRALVFAFPGKSGKPDGSSVTPDRAWIRDSVNVQLLQAGLVYPIFYANQSSQIRQFLIEALTVARENQAGIWAVDRTLTGFSIAGMETLTQEVVIYPKLFRRLMGYLAHHEGTDLGGLADYLRVNSDRLLLASSGEPATLLQFLTIDGQHIQLTQPIENLLFMEK